jgi:hypothetical protein
MSDTPVTDALLATSPHNILHAFVRLSEQCKAFERDLAKALETIAANEKEIERLKRAK